MRACVPGNHFVSFAHELSLFIGQIKIAIATTTCYCAVITCFISRKRHVTERLFGLPLAQPRVISMGRKYWIGRQDAATAMARRASDSEVRLIHYQLAGLYSVKAAQCLPFLLAEKPASAGGRETLHLPLAFAGPALCSSPGEAGDSSPSGERR